MTVDSDCLLTLLEQHARRQVSDYDIGDALHDLAEGVRDVLGLAGAGVSLAKDGHLAFATAHPEAVAAVERVQEETQRGPCAEAFRTGEHVAVADIGTERERWPLLVDAAGQAGLVAVAGVPVNLNETRLGALDLYDHNRREWSEEDLRVAEVLAAMAAALVANADRLDQARTTADQLQHALDSRVVIEQAKGMVASSHDISVDEAFNRLRAHARSHQVSLRSVAEAVVNLRLELDRVGS